MIRVNQIRDSANRLGFGPVRFLGDHLILLRFCERARDVHNAHLRDMLYEIVAHCARRPEFGGRSIHKILGLTIERRIFNIASQE